MPRLWPMAVVGLLAADSYAHAKFEAAGGVNRWGYRGPVLWDKGLDFETASHETRILVLGGSTAFGYGVHWNEAWPAQLEQILHAPHWEDGHHTIGRRAIQVVNLGYNAEGAYAMRKTLDDFAWLEPDIIVLYEGYNDLGGINTNVFRRDSPVFRSTGYLPILPLVIHEKLLSLRSNGYLDAAYRGERIVFHPTMTQRVQTAGFAGADAISAAISAALAEPGDGTHRAPPMDPLRWYLLQMDDSIDWAVRHHHPVLIVGQPTVSAMHRAQQDALQRMIAQQWSDAPFVRYVDLGDLINLHDTSLVLDGLHLNREGNRRIAKALELPVLDAWESVVVDMQRSGHSAP